MEKPQSRRITRELTPEQRAKLAQQQQQLAQELPHLVDRNRMSKEASDEPTLSGEIRRAIHASAQPLSKLAADAGITPLILDEFLTGERTLRSDVMDRLAKALGFVLKRAG
jgi:predicted transcriptional regulator